MWIRPGSVLVAPFSPGENAHRAPVDAWGDWQQVRVIGWSVSTAQPIEGNRRPSAADLTIYAPAGTPNGARWRWKLPDGVYEQVGAAEDYTNGPSLAAFAGLVINVNHVEG